MTHSNEVKQPQFFKITYQGKIAYLLGTSHIFSYQIFPEECLEFMRGCVAFVGEGKEPTEEELIDFRDNFVTYFRRKDDEFDWFSALSEDMQKLAQELFDKKLSAICEKYAPTVLVGDVTLSLVSDIIGYAAKDPWREIISDILEPDYSGCMDFELQDCFEQCYGLEEFFYSFKLEAMNPGNYHRLVNKLKTYMEKNSPQCPEDQLREEREKLNRTWIYYQNAEILTDFDAAEREDSYDDMHIRNQLFLEGILGYLLELPGPLLIAIGDAHLIGEQGLLTKFEDAGVAVELFDPHAKDADSQFKPFHYGYRDYLTSRLYAVKDLRFSPKTIQPMAQVGEAILESVNKIYRCQIL